MKKWLIFLMIILGVSFIIFFVLFWYGFYEGFQCPSYISIAIDKKDVSYCEKHSYGCNPDECYFKTAIGLKDISICNKIKGDQYKEACFYILQQQPEKCSGLNTSYVGGYCYYYISVDPKNISICDNFPDGKDKNFCYFQLFLLGRADNSVCYKLETKDLQQSCFLNFSLCNETEDWRRIDCFTNLAMKNKDYTICNNFSDNSKWECYWKVAVETKNSLICQKIEDVWYREICNRESK